MKIDVEKLREKQAKTGKTLDDLGFCRNTMTRIRRGGNVRPQTVYKFAQALGCEVEDLLKEGGV